MLPHTWHLARYLSSVARLPGYTGATTGAAVHVGPNVLSPAHWTRIVEGELYASSPRIDWRTLLKRTFDVDLRVCVSCSGRLKIRAMVTEPASIAKLLATLRRPRAPPVADA